MSALNWTPVAERLPDAEITVLCWLDTGEWFAGWNDCDFWYDCASGAMVSDVVTHWAEPEGPAA